MKVKIGDKTHDSFQEPIMIILSDKAKKYIGEMAPEFTKYIEYPEIYNSEQIDKWIAGESLKKASEPIEITNIQKMGKEIRKRMDAIEAGYQEGDKEQLNKDAQALNYLSHLILDSLNYKAMYGSYKQLKASLNSSSDKGKTTKGGTMQGSFKQLATANSELFVGEVLKEEIRSELNTKGIKDFDIETPENWKGIWSDSDLPDTGTAQLEDINGNVIGTVSWVTDFRVEQEMQGRVIRAYVKSYKLDLSKGE